jgi:hypothetical protein
MRGLPALLIPCLLACSNAGSGEDFLMVDDLGAPRELTSAAGWESVPFPAPEQCEDGASSAPKWVELEGRQDQKSLTIEHGLGRAPSIVLPYISFSPVGCGSTLAGGDVLIVDFVDSSTIQVRNNTQESFYLRVVLQ